MQFTDEQIERLRAAIARIKLASAPPKPIDWASIYRLQLEETERATAEAATRERISRAKSDLPLSTFRSLRAGGGLMKWGAY